MCGGGGMDDGGAAAQEKERQRKIAEGYQKIKDIFDGHNAGTGNVAAPAVGGSHYTADGRQVNVRNVRTANPAYNPNRRDAYYQDNRRVPRYIDVPNIFAGNENLGKLEGQSLFSGVNHVGGFDDAFYNGREQAYTDFAKPQLEQQYGDAGQELLFALARAGRLQSSTRGKKFGDLQQKYDIQKTNVADKARQYAGETRSNIEKSRADLTALNASLADPNAIANQAQLASASLRQQQAFDPLAPLFQNVTEGIATQADLERRNAARYSSGLFNSGLGGGSGRTIRG